VLEREFDNLKRQVPLREHSYRWLSSVLNTAQQKKRTLQDVVTDLLSRCGTDPEAALLLRDLWEVAKVARSRSANRSVPLYYEVFRLIRGVEDKPFGGEGVMI